MNKTLLDALVLKMDKEQQRYQSWLLKQTPKEILKHAYEYAVRQDILNAVKVVGFRLSESQIQALLSSISPLNDIYIDFVSMETDYKIILHYCIELRADHILESRTAIPVYRHTGTYAKAHKQADQYRLSSRLNTDCKQAIEKAIANHYRDHCLDWAAAEAILEQYGEERVNYVLANSVLYYPYSKDSQISQDNKEWAVSQNIICDKNQSGELQNLKYAVTTVNSGLLNTFIVQVREISHYG